MLQGENWEDLLSNLPDEILCRIISYLPCESALETIFLSRRWKALWNKALVQQTTVDGFANTVSKFAASFDKLDPLRHPRRLQLNFDNGLVLFATISANNKLKVDFFAGERECPRHFDWHLQLINNNNNNDNYNNGPHQISPSTTFYVKTLHLKSVDFLTNEAVSSMVSKFQFLESLKIIECNWLKSLEIESNPKLVNLTILDCPLLESLHLKCSKLRSFRYRGKLPMIKPEYHFNLVDAMLDFRQGPSRDGFTSSDFDPALLTIKNSQILTLCRWAFENLLWPSLWPIKETFQFYKLKELWWIDYLEERHNTDALLSFLKLCPALETLFVTIDPKSYRTPRTSMCLKKSTMHTKLGHLKMVKLEGFMNQEDEITLVKHIKEIFTVKPLVISASDESWSKLLAAPPSPKHAQI